MTKKPLPLVTIKLDKIVGGGQTLATMEDGRKLFVWGGLPGEIVEVQLTKKKSKFAEGVVVNVIESSPERVAPHDEESYLSTSPWQIMSFKAEQHYKAALIEESFELHKIILPNPIDIFTDGNDYGYRNKIEFSWWWDKQLEQLDLAFFRRGTHGKIPVNGSSLARPSINRAAIALRNLLRTKDGSNAFKLKTALIRCDAKDNVIVQLYVKDQKFGIFSDNEVSSLDIIGFELIYSNPKSPASVVTKRLQTWGKTNLVDAIIGVPFTYAVEGFFQINIPVYTQALNDMKRWVISDRPIVDLYSGVGTIGLTIGGKNVTMVESNENAFREMKSNITVLEREKTVRAILAPSENALQYITNNSTVLLDPPRAGLHENVILKLLDVMPERILYLSCNPTTQARDVAILSEKYDICHHRGYNFFPRTPHIEHLIILVSK